MSRSELVTVVMADGCLFVSDPNGKHSFFYTGDVISDGISEHKFIKVEGEEIPPSMYGSHCTTMLSEDDPDWHSNMDDATARAKYLREQAIASSRAYLARLEALKF